MSPPNTPLTLELRQEIDRLATAFEEAWQRETDFDAKAIKAILAQASEAVRLPLLAELVKVDLEKRWEAGERRRVDDYRTAAPALFEPDQPWLADLLRYADELRVRHGEPTGPDPNETSPFSPALEGSVPRRTIGAFVLLELLGRGGFGEVYRARDAKLNRIVALKVLRSDGSLTMAERDRFLREAQSAACLSHPHIVEVYERGLDGGTPYIVSRFIAGPTLAEHLRRQLPTPTEAATLTAKIADALEHAHRHGVVHRDVKPKNILLDGKGDPHLADFGLARRLEDAGSSLTVSGEILGTPAYMAPEQAQGHVSRIGPHSDIYSLGVVLYELLTGTVPFVGPFSEVLRKTAEDDPIWPRKLNPKAPRELEAICLKCLHKNPPQRYTSAAALAEDLERYLTGRPVLAKPPNVVERTVKWVKRRPWQAASGGAAAAALAGLLVAAWTYGERQNAERLHQLERAADAKLLAERRYQELVNATRAANRGRPPGWTWDGIKRIADAAEIDTSAKDLADLRTELVECLTGIDFRQKRTLYDDFRAFSLAFRADGSQLALGRHLGGLLPGDGLIVLDVASGKLLHREQSLSRHDHIDLAYSPDGRFLAAGLQHGDLRFWDAAAGYHAIALEGKHSDHAIRVAFHPDQPLLYSCDSAGHVKAWHFHGRNEKREASWQAPKGCTDLAVHPGGTQLLVMHRGEKSVYVQQLHARTLAPQSSFSTHGYRMALSPDGRLLVTLDEGRGTLCNAESGAEHFRLHGPGVPPLHLAEATRVRFHPHAALLMTASWDGSVKLWEAATGRLAATIAAIPGQLSPIFHPNGRSLIVDDDKRVIEYELGGLNIQSWLGVQPEVVHAFAWHPSEPVLATLAGGDSGDDRATVVLWDADGKTRAERVWKPLVVDDRKARSEHVLVFAPDGSALLVAFHRSHTAYLLDTRLDRVLRDLDWSVIQAQFASDGKMLFAAGGSNTQFKCWRIADWHELARFDSRELFGINVAVSSRLRPVIPGRRWVIAACEDKILRVFDTAKPAERVERLKLTQTSMCEAALHPQETLAVVGEHSGHLTVFMLPHGPARKPVAAHHARVETLAFHPKEDWLVSGGRDRVLNFWRLADDGLVKLFQMTFPGEVLLARFRPDGLKLAVLIRGEHGVRLLHLDRMRARFRELALDWE